MPPPALVGGHLPVKTRLAAAGRFRPGANIGPLDQTGVRTRPQNRLTQGREWIWKLLCSTPHTRPGSRNNTMSFVKIFSLDLVLPTRRSPSRRSLLQHQGGSTCLSYPDLGRYSSLEDCQLACPLISLFRAAERLRQIFASLLAAKLCVVRSQSFVTLA